MEKMVAVHRVYHRHPPRCEGVEEPRPPAMRVHHLWPEASNKAAELQRNAGVEPIAEEICCEEGYTKSASLPPKIGAFLRYKAQRACTIETFEDLHHVRRA